MAKPYETVRMTAYYIRGGESRMSGEGCQAYSGQFPGLSEAEAEIRRKEYGMNILPARERPSRMAIFLSQFTNPLVYVILGAAVISLLLREFRDFTSSWLL